VRFEALIEAGQPIFAIYYDGGEDRRVGSCNPNDIAKVAAVLCSIFLVDQERSKTDIRRMRDLVAAVGIRKIAGRGALGPKSRVLRVLPSEAPMRIGVHALKELDAGPANEMTAYVGLGLAFGRVAAEDLDRFAKRAAEYGATELRLTPWRAMLVPLPSLQSALDLAGCAAGEGFILDPVDPRRQAAACVGAPSCRSATTDVRSDATQLAPLVAEGSFLHVSGCAKGCAHPRAAPVTLVGRDGLYDLVLNGAPSDSPSIRCLTLDEAAGHLRQMAAQHSQGGTA
jgi:precorrin-3B synthase